MQVKQSDIAWNCVARPTLRMSVGALFAGCCDEDCLRTPLYFPHSDIENRELRASGGEFETDGFAEAHYGAGDDESSIPGFQD